MEYRQLGNSGLRVPVLSFGTGTFGGSNEFFKAWGNTQVDEATRLINLCLEAGVNLFDTADAYSGGEAEEILGKALKGLRNKVLISTKAGFATGEGANDYGTSRLKLIKACEDSLKRLGTDHIDIYHMHAFDANTPIEETLKALEHLVESGKVRYIACSNFSGWHLMKSLSVSERYGWSKYIGHQAHYSLLNRDFEWELMPLGIEENIGTIVWSPLASGKLSGKYRRDQTVPQDGRVAQGGSPLISAEADDQRLYNIVDVLDELAEETGKNAAQIALNWLLQRPTVSSIIIGARNEQQLKQNLEAVGWNLTLDQIKRLDKASDTLPAYPYWHQRQTPILNSAPKLY
ncbi:MULTISPECIES: aldo/keto reductase [Flavobacterium]|jgi:aryl-alcohol dehydrogenase-like predicted oxidoreductase|uniref:1-deoxyxylulose-5-phosphate synthase YajO n=1 Tax=Flavobacterium bizetiae TaxID=2704140 RepID=A0A6J4GUM2_9FLAO|nr:MULTISPECIES: aldo/keto reductase [Flavobacterium]CAA9202577.1 1-deoxyxylulose-5-phosphate synthase YajO [Flavobacterium bizetiae]CAD5340057.1 1-deoxyxylulose-5-phosphate synthase YajO [Flavobacterium bizetiae]CAD5350817.1 1-deoxyxylulose-5-phosphate synthase YajO [Flavobacterium bizetiae]